MNTLEDTYKFKGQRERLVETLVQKGIRDVAVLSAIMKLPRHYFFSREFYSRAYEDEAFPIGEGQTISQPYTVAFQTELLKIVPGTKVLEVGTGSGYQAAILSQMGAEVYSIEYNKVLFQGAVEVLKALKIRVKCYLGDGSRGLATQAPFDRILLTAAAPGIKEHLLEQLAAPGIMVAPVGGKEVQRMMVYEKSVDNKIVTRDKGHFKFVPLLGQYGWENS